VNVLTKRTLAIAAAGLLAAGCGGDDDEGDGNAARFEGPKAEVAAVVDRLGEAAREGDTKTICEEIVTRDLQTSVREASGKSCAAEFEANVVSDDTRYEINAIEVDGDEAVARVTDQEGRRSRLFFGRESDSWRISRIE